MSDSFSLITPAQLKSMLQDGAELSLLDVREQGRFFNDGHLLFACPLPLSALDLRITDLVPRKSARVVLCDAGEGLAQRAAAAMEGFGYGNLSVLEGGTAAWKAAGYELFSGFNVPSKAFGEFVEHAYSTPSISAEELKEMMERNEDLVVVDSRPMDEYQVMNIPTGIDVPGAELALRIHDIAPSPDTTVVVNCAGRTRSIIGAQSLVNAGIPNKVVDLRNGTMGWHLAGYKLERGSTRRASEPSAEGLQKAKAAASRVARRFGCKEIDTATLEKWRGERESRTLYMFDVRHPEEFEAGHLPGSRSAPGGQLVQATDLYVGTRHARIVLVDDNGVRATMTASWLLQLGWRDVFVLAGGLPADGLESGPHRPHIPGPDAIEVEKIAPQELEGALAEGDIAVIDLGYSRDYLKGHIPGAWFAIRARLGKSISKLPESSVLVLTSGDGLAARLAAPEVRALTGASVKVLEGGTAAWRDGGHAMDKGEGQAIDSMTDDAVMKPYDHEKGAVEQAMREYLSWEVKLVEQLERDGGATFEKFPE